MKNKGWRQESERHALASRGIKDADIYKLNKIRAQLFDQENKTNKSYHVLDKLERDLSKIFKTNSKDFTTEEKEELLNIQLDISNEMDKRANKDLGNILKRLTEFQRKQIEKMNKE